MTVSSLRRVLLMTTCASYLTIETSADQCNIIDKLDGQTLPVLACCEPDLDDKTPSQGQCVFTSFCNSYGLCCEDPYKHDEYLPSK